MRVVGCTHTTSSKDLCRPISLSSLCSSDRRSGCAVEIRYRTLELSCVSETVAFVTTTSYCSWRMAYINHYKYVLQHLPIVIPVAMAIGLNTYIRPTRLTRLPDSAPTLMAAQV